MMMVGSGRSVGHDSLADAILSDDQLILIMRADSAAYVSIATGLSNTKTASLATPVSPIFVIFSNGKVRSRASHSLFILPSSTTTPTKTAPACHSQRRDKLDETH